MTTWSAADMPDLSGRTALITGANSGIGYHTALHLAEHGAHVLLSSRNPERGERAVASIAEKLPKAAIELVRLDLADLGSVREAAAAVLAEHDTIDLLVNNAGEKMLPERTLTKDGFVAQFGTNHLGHFALTGLLLPALKSGSRVITVTSLAHRFVPLDLTDPQLERGYSGNRAYSQSKLANMLFTLELDRRLTGTGILSLAAHPGFATDTVTTMLGKVLLRPLIQSMSQGALPTLYAATAPTIPGGTLIGPGNLSRTKGSPRVERPSPKARDERVARGLWELSEELTDVRYLSQVS
jgi:NAD(P)-dependent dehydrogenase (short-subunit alcohol dehydrogenase family)